MTGTIAENFFYRHHVEPRVKLCVPNEESFPIPLEDNDVTRSTHTGLDVLQEKRIDDYWKCNHFLPHGSVFAHFPNDRHCEVRKRDQHYKGSLQEAHW